MKDNAKTVVFAVVAAAILLITWFSRPTLTESQPEEMIGRELFPEFTDPLMASSLVIDQFDEASGSPRNFEVAQVKGVWSIPSHSSYPTDASNQLAAAAGGLMHLKVLSLASVEPGDHAEYGVLDPTTSKSGATGVGTRVIMRDPTNKDLLYLIIGKSAAGDRSSKTSSADRSNLYYVRRVGQDQVYVVECKTDKLSTKFEDWIEKNLLKISSWDIKGLQIEDYSVVKTMDRMGIDQRGIMDLACNDTDPKWALTKAEAFDAKQRKWVPSPLAKDEELDTSKLDAVKTALDDLKIVDVARKPAGLSANLKAKGEIKLSQEAASSLAECGFYLVGADSPGSYDLVSDKGEVRVQMKDGVEYVLRFGEVAGMGAEKKKDAKKDDKKDDKKDGKKDEKKDDAPGGPGVNRYLFVMAQFSPALVAKPELEKLPEEKPAEKTEAKKDEKKDEAKKDSGDSKKAEASKEEAKKDEAKKDEAKKDDPKEDAKKDDAKKDEVKKDDPKDDAKKDEAKKDESKEDAKKDDAKKDDSKKDEKKPDLKAERERIEKENKRKEDEYQDKLKKGKEHANELNGRFADWYYVISDDVYQKIHLSREQIVKKKEKPKDEDKSKDDKSNAKEGEADHDHDHGAKPEATDAGEKPSPLGEFDKLKKEGPEEK